MKFLGKFHHLFALLFFFAAVSYGVDGLTGTDVLGSVFAGGVVHDVLCVLVLVAAVMRLDDVWQKLVAPDSD